jgi:hypothetical protein
MAVRPPASDLQGPFTCSHLTLLTQIVLLGLPMWLYIYIWIVYCIYGWFIEKWLDEKTILRSDLKKLEDK